uniref:Uncharacterized protein n=1 Tax=viral metagenome TaxID=1070528 RepID=A0A6H1ZQU2_9ZZZZ
MRAFEIMAQVAGYTGWPLEYIGGLPYGKLVYTYNIISYQRQAEWYRLELLIGQLIAMWAKGNHKPEDIAGKGPMKPQEVTMVRKAEPQVVVLGDGKEYTLPIINGNIMEAVEEEFNQEWADIFKAMRVKHLKGLLRELLRSQHPNITLDEVGALLTPEAIVNVSKAIPKLM